MSTVNVTRVAQALNLSPQRVQQLVHEGMPREARGQYDPIKCMHFYIRFLQRAIEKRTAPMEGNEDVRGARVRLLRADADLREMELAKQRSQLVSIQDVEKEMTDLILTSKARIMAVAPRVAPELLGVTSRVMAQAILEKAIKEALLALSKRPRRESPAEQGVS